MIRLVRRARSRFWEPALRAQREFYSRPWSEEEICRWQLERFNRLWQKLCREVPYYCRLRQERHLPPSFANWEEVQEGIPVTDRRRVQAQGREMVSGKRRPAGVRITGGSTGQPVRVPVWRSESSYASASLWYARSWFGVTPSDRAFLIWGHSHLLGTGARGWINGKIRQIKDRVVGYSRWSAYDLDEEALRRAGEELLEQRPEYLLAYATALARFARVNADRASQFRRLGLKVAVATAESFVAREDSREVAEILGCPVAMEYGTVETGPIAHQTPEGSYQVFWRDYWMEARPSPEVSGACEIFLTALYPRCFPLVRYQVGDLVQKPAGRLDSVCRLDRVIGRCNDWVLLPGGRVIHSEAFAHALREIAVVTDFAVEQRVDGGIRLRYMARRPLQDGEAEHLRNRLSRIAPGLEHVLLERTGSLEQTVAGKVRRFRRDLPVPDGPAAVLSPAPESGA